MALRRYFNRGNKKRELSSDNSVSGDDPKMIYNGSFKDFKNVDSSYWRIISSNFCCYFI